ncbi:unnamed protein product [Paramecium sonneborni]|uniref:Uncharacterized protein n=1 Tax=Paramecium sonneborni TaxID=65129 RepID=A0A8S1RRI1_9CILI|nr:unnamed protein product [Paramecium sonneborni]
MSRSSRRNSQAIGSLLDYTNSDDTYNVKAIIYENHNQNLLILKTQKLYNSSFLLQQNEQLSELYFQYIQAQIDKNIHTKQEVEQWVNQQNDEGFTALHLAAYRGSLKTIKLLEQYWADYQIKNYKDLTVLHTATQGDCPLTIYYYLKKGIQVNIVDNKGSSPLHWAAYSGAFNAVNFLISWNANLNLEDTDTSVTPLHLATMQANSRIVRKLLMKRADRSIKDSSGKTALDLAIESDYKTVATMIRDKNDILIFCNVRQSFRPVTQKRNSQIAFLSMYMTCFLLTIAFTFPCRYLISIVNTWSYKNQNKKKKFSTIWMWIFFALTSITVIFFFISCSKDAGICYKHWNDIIVQTFVLIVNWLDLKDQNIVMFVSNVLWFTIIIVLGQIIELEQKITLCFIFSLSVYFWNLFCNSLCNFLIIISIWFRDDLHLLKIGF